MSTPISELKVIEGDKSATGLRFAIVVSRFNAFITEQMLGGAVDHLVRSGAAASDIEVVRTPGSFEIPMVVDQVLRRGHVDAVIALGCLIKGDCAKPFWLDGVEIIVGAHRIIEVEENVRIVLDDGARQDGQRAARRHRWRDKCRSANRLD